MLYSRPALALVLSSALLSSIWSCNMTKLAVNTQSDVMQQASPVMEEQTDYEFARAAAPASLLQIDGLLRVAPDNEKLLLLGTKGWASFAYGFVEDDMERAELAGDLEQADAERDRARAMYLKAKGLGLRLLETMEQDIDQALQRDPDALKRFLAANFTDREAVPALFWTGYAWASAINLSRDDPALLADLPLPRTLIERAVDLDETYFHAAGHVFLGVVNASLGKSIGGAPEKGRVHFERALSLTRRRAMMVHVNYAKTYAVQKQDRKLFVSLLNEVIDTPIPEGTPLSLPNTVARRRAERLLAQVDNLILPPLDTMEPAASEPEAAAAEVAPEPAGEAAAAESPEKAAPAKESKPAKTETESKQPAPYPSQKKEKQLKSAPGKQQGPQPETQSRPSLPPTG